MQPSKKNKTHAKMGQRKLLLMEVKFLVKYGGLSNVVVYAGAAPGKHISFLAELFPNHIFHLYDPRDFNDGTKHHSRISTYNVLFTNTLASQYESAKVLFISDIRQNVKGKNINKIEQVIEEDMKMQKEWVHLMQPAAAMLKYRLPVLFTSNTTSFTYLHGDIWFQPWAPLLTYETRLVITPPYSLATFDKKDYMISMIQRNKIRHTKKPHKVPLKKCPGLCHCVECGEEISIWRQYGAKSNTEITNLMRRCSTNSTPLGRHKRWKYANPKEWFPKNEFANT